MRVRCSGCDSTYSVSITDIEGLPNSEFRCGRCGMMIRLLTCGSCGSLYAVTYGNLSDDKIILNCVNCSSTIDFEIDKKSTAPSQEGDIYASKLSESVPKPVVESEFNKSSPGTILGAFDIKALGSMIKKSLNLKMMKSASAWVMISLTMLGLYNAIDSRFLKLAEFGGVKFAGTFSMLIPVALGLSMYLLASSDMIKRISGICDNRSAVRSSFVLMPKTFTASLLFMALLSIFITLFFIMPGAGTLLFIGLLFVLYIVSGLIFFAGFLAFFFLPSELAAETGFVKSVRNLWSQLMRNPLRLLSGLLMAAIISGTAFVLFYIIIDFAVFLFLALGNIAGLEGISKNSLGFFSSGGLSLLGNNLGFIYALFGGFHGSFNPLYFFGYAAVFFLSILNLSAVLSITAPVSERIYKGVKSGGKLFDRSLYLSILGIVIVYALIALLKRWGLFF